LIEVDRQPCNNSSPFLSRSYLARQQQTLSIIPAGYVDTYEATSLFAEEISSVAKGTEFLLVERASNSEVPAPQQKAKAE
jgi:hypothetical protein